MEGKFFDFYLPDYKQIIERDGEQHYKYVELYARKAGGKRYFLKNQVENDKKKTDIAKNHGYKISRIPYWLNNEDVAKEIDNILEGNPTYPDVPDLKQAKTKPLPK